MYYLYRHIRVDKNEVFYVGIGTKSSEILIKSLGNTMRGVYRRAFEKNKSRNSHWKNIFNKTEVLVEIVLESKFLDEIQGQERIFIELHKSTICNLTIGGYGIESFKHTEESKRKIGVAFKGKKLTQEHINKANQRKYKSISMIKNNIVINNFSSLKSAAIYLGNPKYIKNISSCLKGKRPTAYGYKFKYNENVELQDKELVS